MLHSAGGRSSNSDQQRRTNYPDDISTQQRINLPNSQLAFNNRSNQLPFQNQEPNQNYTNQRYITNNYKYFGKNQLFFKDLVFVYKDVH